MLANATIFASGLFESCACVYSLGRPDASRPWSSLGPTSKRTPCLNGASTALVSLRLRFTPPCRIAALQGEPARQLQEAEEGSQWFVDYWIVCSSLLQLLKAIAQKKAALAEQQQS